MGNKKITLGLAVVFAVLLAAVLYLRIGRKSYTVTDYFGMTQQEVTSWMEKNNVPSEKVVFIYTYSDSYPENTVIAQNIHSGGKIKDGQVLTVTISEGDDPNRLVEIADFNGMNQDQITEWLDENGFVNYQFISEINEKEPEDLFLWADPAVGKKIRLSDELLICICAHDHSGIVYFPDFTGKAVADIEEWANENSISVNYIYYTNDAPYGSFLFSDYPEGTELEKDVSQVSVAVSAGPGY